MRIGIYLPDIDPKSGGAFTFVETVLGSLGTRADDSVVVYHYGTSDGLADRFAGTRVRFHSLARTRAGRLARKAWFGQVAARLQGPVHLASQVLHRSLPQPAASPLDRAARGDVDLVWFPTPLHERVDVPYAITIWDLEHRLQPYFPELGTHAEWARREQMFGDALRRATFVVTGTAVGRDEIVRFYNVDRDRIRLLPHPTPSFAIEAAREPAAPLRLPVATPFVFYPAQFWAHKNHVGLLRAIAELARRGIAVDCALVGSDTGNLAHVRAQAAELGIAERVHFLGFVERADLVALYRHAAALVYTSLCGPENLPPLEAMALGCPVIASDIAGAREQLGDAAVLVDTLDAGALADAIAGVLADPARRAALIAKGRARAQHYTQREFGRDLGAILDEFRRRHDLWAR